MRVTHACYAQVTDKTTEAPISAFSQSELLKEMLHMHPAFETFNDYEEVKEEVKVGAIMVMAACNSKMVYKWELAKISNIGQGNMVWGRIKARGNREFSCCPTDQLAASYGNNFLLVKPSSWSDQCLDPIMMLIMRKEEERGEMRRDTD